MIKNVDSTFFALTVPEYEVLERHYSQKYHIDEIQIKSKRFAGGQE